MRSGCGTAPTVPQPDRSQTRKKHPNPTDDLPKDTLWSGSSQPEIQMTTPKNDLLPAKTGTSQSRRTFPSHRTDLRAEQLADIAASGTDDGSECAASDAFKEFSLKEGK